jgi:hypothetical protein
MQPTLDDRESVRRGHQRRTVVELWNIDDGHVMDLPITDGSVTVSLSGSAGQRSGSLTVPGYGNWADLDPGNVTWVVVRQAVGTDWWTIAELPVVRVVSRRPRGVVEVTLGDWSFRRSHPMSEAAVTIGGTGLTVASVCRAVMAGALGPGFTITRDDTAGAFCASPVNIQFGGSVWSSLTSLCNAVGAILTITGRQSGQVRRFDPLAAAVDDLDGTVQSESIGVLGDEAFNRAVVQVDGEGADGGSFRAMRTLTTGPYAFDQARFGLFAVTDSMRLPTATQEVAETEAQRLFDRRVGVVRSCDVEVLSQPWLQAGDVVTFTPHVSGPYRGIIDSITYPLTASGTMRIAMRDSLTLSRGVV